MNNKPHPHAEILRAIADGVPLSEFEVTNNGRNWLNVKDAKMTDWFFSDPQQWQVRRKPRTHVVNGFTVPAPLVSLTHAEDYFLVCIQDGNPRAETRHNNTETIGALHCRRGIVHSTKEAAIANAKAMLKIDPEAA